jgi:hypothetical protein
VLAQSAKFEIPGRLLRRLEADFEQETPGAHPMTRNSLVAATEKPRSSNQRAPKRRASLPPSYLRPEVVSSAKRDRTSKAPSTTREASPSLV